MLNCTSLVISYVIAFLMSSIIYYQINIILYGSFHTSCITFHIQSYTKYRFISYICIISRSFYHISSHIILARGSSAFPRAPKTLRFQIWVSLNEALTVPKMFVGGVSTYIYHGSSLPEKSNISIYISIYLYKWRNVYIYIFIRDNCWHLKIPFCWYKTFPVDGFQLLFFFGGGMFIVYSKRCLWLQLWCQPPCHLSES